MSSCPTQSRRSRQPLRTGKGGNIRIPDQQTFSPPMRWSSRLGRRKATVVTGRERTTTKKVGRTSKKKMNPRRQKGRTLVLPHNLEERLATRERGQVLALLLQALGPREVAAPLALCGLLHVLGKLRVRVLAPVVVVDGRGGIATPADAGGVRARAAGTVNPFRRGRSRACCARRYRGIRFKGKRGRKGSPPTMGQLSCLLLGTVRRASKQKFETHLRPVALPPP